MDGRSWVCSYSFFTHESQATRKPTAETAWRFCRVLTGTGRDHQAFATTGSVQTLEHVIPLHWFLDLSQLTLLGIVAAAAAALVMAADRVVDGASGLALRAGIHKVIVGATIVSLGTTSPECAVSVMAAWSGDSGLALGNAVGSIIADTALIFGLCCLITPLPADRFVLNRQGWIQLGCGVLLAALCYGAYAIRGDQATLTRPVGLLLLGLLVVYMAVSIRWSRQHPHGSPFQTPDVVAGSPLTPETQETQRHRRSAVLVLMLLVGLAIVMVSSRVMICAVTALAGQWGVPQVVIAATIVAIGTSLPELVVGLASIAKGHKELMVGNVIGADILNVLFVVGASGTAAGLPIIEHGERIFIYLHLPTMLAALVLLRLFVGPAIRRGHFRRWQGVPLLMLYVAYVVGQFAATRS